MLFPELLGDLWTEDGRRHNDPEVVEKVDLEEALE